jgi:hypothetical protein
VCVAGAVEQPFETQRFEPGVIVEEKEELAVGDLCGAIVTFAITEVGAVLEVTSVGPVFEYGLGDGARAVWRQVIGDDNFDVIEQSLIAERVETSFKPGSAIVIEDDDAEERGSGWIHERAVKGVRAWVSSQSHACGRTLLQWSD